MAKIEFEVAAIYYACHDIIGIKEYFDEIPQDFIVPCIYFPPPEVVGGAYSSSAYKSTFTMFAKVFSKTSLEASKYVSEILQSISKLKNKVALVDESGNKTGVYLRLENLKSNKVDDGVYQIEFTWKRYTSFMVDEITRARDFYFNGTRIQMEEE